MARERRRGKETETEITEIATDREVSLTAVIKAESLLRGMIAEGEEKHKRNEEGEGQGEVGVMAEITMTPPRATVVVIIPAWTDEGENPRSTRRTGVSHRRHRGRRRRVAEVALLCQ